MKFRSTVLNISTYSFLFALFGYILVSEIFLPTLVPDSQILRIVLAFLSTIGLYTLIFQFVFYVYSKHLYKKVDRRLDISGEWYQVFVIEGSQNAIQGVRQGVCIIDAEVDQISIAGQNHRVDDNNTFSSNWNSEATSLSGRKLSVLYVSQGTSRPEEISISRGTMDYQLIGNPPSRLSGNWRDVTPARHSGTISLFRDKAKYEKYLAEVMRSFEPIFSEPYEDADAS